MHDLKTFRREWSSDQKELRMMLKAGTDLDQARDLFLSQHAVLHSCSVSGMDSWSYSDEIFSGLSEEEFRFIPKSEDHSLIWIMWHISRIEDITMNILVAGGEQIYSREGWKTKLGSPLDHTGNGAPTKDINIISRILDPATLHLYRIAVGQGTRTVFSDMPSSDLKDPVLPERLNRLIHEGAVLPHSEGLLSYWGNRKIFELFLMPPTRHLMSHLNEAFRIKKKTQKGIN